MWIRQQICGPDINYDLWKEQKATLQKWAALTSGNLFAVDVYAQNYSFASDHFSDLFGYKLSQLRTIEKQGDLLEDKIHPEDHDRMIAMQIKHSEFIYSLPLENRNDFQSIYCFRMQHVHGNYIHVTSRQQVLLTDRNKKAWIILGSMEISPDQTPDKNFRYSFIHRKTGKVFSPDCLLKTDKKTHQQGRRDTFPDPAGITKQRNCGSTAYKHSHRTQSSQKHSYPVGSE